MTHPPCVIKSGLVDAFYGNTRYTLAMWSAAQGSQDHRFQLGCSFRHLGHRAKLSRGLTRPHRELVYLNPSLTLVGNSLQPGAIRWKCPCASHVHLPTNRPCGRCRSDNRSAKPLIGSRRDDGFQLSTLRNDPSVSHKRRLPGRAPLLGLHQSLSEPPRALGASMTGTGARCLGAGGSLRQRRAGTRP